MYKKALNAFFLQVHPDFFHHNHTQQVANEQAVAQLNELLSWAREFKAGTLRPPPATTIAFTFYRRLDGEKDDNQAPKSSFAERGFSTAAEGEVSGGAVQVNSTFELPDGFAASEANRGVVERSVNKFLRDLLRRSGCIDGVTESVSEAEDATIARREAKPLRRRPHRKGGPDPRNEAPKSLLDEATEAMSMRWSLTPVPTLEEIIEADQVLFSQSISPLQCAAAMQTLRDHLGEMRYEVWECMPLIVSDHFAVGEMTGCITVPWDFTPYQFISFLAQHQRAVDACRENAFTFASELEGLIADVCNALSLDDILISCSHKDAMPTLRLLRQYKELLHGYGVSSLSLEIGSRFATRANGVIILDHSMNTADALHKWLKAIQPKLDLQKKLYRISKHMLETTMWHLKEFRTIIEPAGVEAFQHNDCTYAQRLEWAKELFRIAGSLAQWDWSEFTFILGPELDMNWSSRQFVLPANFDGDAFVRYVEEIQQESKKAKREELLKESSAQLVQAESARSQQHANELQLPQEGMLPHSQDAASGTASATTLRDLHRRHSPHLEEYLTSSDYGVDRLTTERPLSHAVHFNSDTETEEQLKWEGLYEEPFVDQVPTGDLDDLNHTFAITNRWHREEAAKKLLGELQSTYGSKSRRFEYQKMGDVLEINNAKVQPKGFPVLSRGVRRGDE